MALEKSGRTVGVCPLSKSGHPPKKNLVGAPTIFLKKTSHLPYKPTVKKSFNIISFSQDDVFYKKVSYKKRALLPTCIEEKKVNLKIRTLIGMATLEESQVQPFLRQIGHLFSSKLS